MVRAVFKGCGICVAQNKVVNSRLAKIMDTSDQWIRERTGIESRYFVNEGTASSDLGAVAARNAIEDAGIDKDEIDYIVCATMTPDHYFPGSATLIQTKLGLDPLPSLDIRQQCSGFVYGLQVVDVLIRAGVAKTVLLVGTDVHTEFMPFSEKAWKVVMGEDDGEIPQDEYDFYTRFRHLLVLFGDAAGAMVFQAEESDKGIIDVLTRGDGKDVEILRVPGVGSVDRPYVSERTLKDDSFIPYMEGRKVFKLAVSLMPSITVELLERNGLGVDDIDLLVMHQANLRINEMVRKNLKLSPDKVYNNIHKYGNTTSATIPLVFYEAREKGLIKDNSLVAFCALGAGLHWGAALLRV